MAGTQVRFRTVCKRTRFRRYNPADLFRNTPWCLALALSAACGKAPTSLSFAGGTTLVFAKDGSSLALERGGQTLLTFGRDAFQLGTVNSLTYGSPSFDPFWLGNPNASPPAGLTWRTLPANGAMKLLKSTATEMLIEV